MNGPAGFPLMFEHGGGSSGGVAPAPSTDCRTSLPSAGDRLPPQEVAELFWCRQLADGSWATATVGDTRAFVRPNPLDPNLAPQLEQGRAAILAEIRRFAGDPRITRLFVYDLDTQSVTVASTGRTFSLVGLPLTAPPVEVANYQASYDQAALSYFLAPGSEVLSAYAFWYVSRRDSAVLALTVDMHPLFQKAFINMTSYDTAPWPWQLADPYTIDSYLLHLNAMTGSR